MQAFEDGIKIRRQPYRIADARPFNGAKKAREPRHDFHSGRSFPSVRLSSEVARTSCSSARLRRRRFGQMGEGRQLLPDTLAVRHPEHDGPQSIAAADVEEAHG